MSIEIVKGVYRVYYSLWNDGLMVEKSSMEVEALSIPDAVNHVKTRVRLPNHSLLVINTKLIRRLPDNAPVISSYDKE